MSFLSKLFETKKPKILAADDNHDILEMMVQVLKQIKDIEILEATDG